MYIYIYIKKNIEMKEEYEMNNIDNRYRLFLLY